MSRRQQSLSQSLIVATALAVTAGAAFADDSSMSMWTGDSYAFFNNLEYSAGKFNTARAPQARDHDIAETSVRGELDRLGQPIMMDARPSLFTRPPLVT